MTDHDDFLKWVKTDLHDAEVAVHNGDPDPRRVIWSRNDPVSVLGAVVNAHGQQELDALFTELLSTSDSALHTERRDGPLVAVPGSSGSLKRPRRVCYAIGNSACCRSPGVESWLPTA